jgi:hypothetical protein
VNKNYGVIARAMRWAWHVALIGNMNAYKILVEKPEWKRYSEDLGLDGRIILERILQK